MALHAILLAGSSCAHIMMVDWFCLLLICLQTRKAHHHLHSTKLCMQPPTRDRAQLPASTILVGTLCVCTSWRACVYQWCVCISMVRVYINGACVYQWCVCISMVCVYQWCVCISMVHVYINGACVYQWCVYINGACVYQWCVCISMVRVYINGACVYQWCPCASDHVLAV